MAHSGALLAERLARIASARARRAGQGPRDDAGASTSGRAGGRRRSAGAPREAGLIIETAGPRDEIVKILAPLTTPETLLERGLDIVEEAVAAGREPVAAL